ncbi:MAG: hypothetical protein GXP49_02275 [Deltaproteobacteria bacterium]|nr:hypothetical protein [Deltaproteobacteria bacterium]
MNQHDTYTSRVRKSSARRRLFRNLYRLAAFLILLGAVYFFLAERIPFLMGINGIVIDRKIKRVHVIEEDGGVSQDRYFISIKENNGKTVELKVPYKVFVLAKEGSPVFKYPFSNHYSFE